MPDVSSYAIGTDSKSGLLDAADAAAAAERAGLVRDLEHEAAALRHEKRETQRAMIGARSGRAVGVAPVGSRARMPVSRHPAVRAAAQEARDAMRAELEVAREELAVMRGAQVQRHTTDCP